MPPSSAPDLDRGRDGAHGAADGAARATEELRRAHASGLAAVSRELAALHAATLRAGGEDDRMVRLSVLTLVAACTDDDDAERAAAVVREIAAEHPARAVIVVADRERADGIEADLSLECTVDGAQVCAELVRLRVGGAPALHLGSVVTPLLLPDVPVHLWLLGAPELTQALTPESLAVAEGLILDSETYSDPRVPLTALAAAAAAADGGVPVADLAWSRLTPWRELIARAFDAPSRRSLLAGIRSVEIVAAGERPSSEAILLDAWLRSRLAGVGAPPPAALSAQSDDDLDPGAGRLRAVRISASAEGREAMVEVRREDAATLATSVVVDGEDVAARRVPTVSPSLSELVGAALQASGADPIHTAALAAAALAA